MTSKDWPNSYKFMNDFGKKVVKAIQARIDQKGLIITGDLRKSIGYKIIESKTSFSIYYTINEALFGDFHPTDPALPEEYGVYVNYTKKGKNYFTATIPGLTQNDFRNGLDEPMRKDVDLFIKKQAADLKKKKK